MTPTATQVSDVITYSIEREDGRQRKWKRKITLLETLSRRRKKESGFLLKEKKKNILGTWSLRKKKKKKKKRKDIFRDLVSKKKKMVTRVHPCLTGG